MTTQTQIGVSQIQTSSTLIRRSAFGIAGLAYSLGSQYPIKTNYITLLPINSAVGKSSLGYLSLGVPCNNGNGLNSLTTPGLTSVPGGVSAQFGRFELGVVAPNDAMSKDWKGAALPLPSTTLLPTAFYAKTVTSGGMSVVFPVVAPISSDPKVGNAQLGIMGLNPDSNFRNFGFPGNTYGNLSKIYRVAISQNPAYNAAYIIKTKSYAPALFTSWQIDTFALPGTTTLPTSILGQVAMSTRTVVVSTSGSTYGYYAKVYSLVEEQNQVRVFKYQLGKTNLYNTTYQFPNGITRIQITGDFRTFTGVSRIITPNIHGITRIQVTAPVVTLSGKSTFNLRTSQYPEGIANIYATTTQTWPGKSRVQLTAPDQTLTGVSHFNLRGIPTLSGVSAFTKIKLLTTQVIAEVLCEGSPITNVRSTQQVAEVLCELATRTLQPFTGKSRIQSTISSVLQRGHASIGVTGTQQSIRGDCHIIANVTLQSITGVSDILNHAPPDYQHGVSNIQAAGIRLQLGKTRITATDTITYSGKSNIVLYRWQVPQLGKTNIFGTTDQPNSGVTKITNTTRQIQTGKSRIEIVSHQIQEGKSYIVVGRVLQSQTGVVNIKAATHKLQFGTANIFPSEYYFDVIRHDTSYTNTSASLTFTASGITAVSNGEGDMGHLNFKRVLGFRRPTGSYKRQIVTDGTQYEFIKIPLFVAQAIDWTPISTSVGFAVSGKTATAGYGIVGRDLEKYATLGVLTNVRNTQENLEILATGNPPVRMSQIVHEVILKPISDARLSQITKEVITLINLGIVNGIVNEGLFSGDNVHGGKASTDFVCVELMTSCKAMSLLSQVTKEILATGDPNVCMSQISEEILVYNQLVSYSNALIDCVAIEALRKPTSNVTIDCVTCEILIAPASNVLIENLLLETIHTGHANAAIKDVVMEEIGNSTTMQACVDMIAVEMLIKSEHDPMVAGMVNNPRVHV